MTTTCIRDSIVGDQWIQATAAQIPIQKIVNPDTGIFEGDILTGPVRLSFFQDSLFELPKPMTNSKGEPQGEPKYGSHLLFTPFAAQSMNVLVEEYYRLCAAEFAEYWNGVDYAGLETPFKDQGLKAAKYAGYTPGCFYLNSTSLFRPQVVDRNRNPIVDKSKVYPGIWALAVVRGYASGKRDKLFKKGIQFGLQSVMIIGDDEKFGASGPDAQTLYKGVQVTAPPISARTAAGIPGGAPAGMPGVPQGPGPGIPGYIAPGGGVQRPAGIPGQAAPQVPQQTWSPQGQPAAIPGQPAAPFAPAVPGSAPYGAPQQTPYMAPGGYAQTASPSSPQQPGAYVDEAALYR